LGTDSVSNAPSNDSLFVDVDSGIYLYAAKIGLTFSDNKANSTWLDLKLVKKIEGESSCDVNATDAGSNSSCVVVLGTNETIQHIRGFSLRFEFSKSGALDPGYWSVSQLLMTYTNESNPSEPIEVVMDHKAISDWTPVGLSYSCYAPDSVKPMKSSNKTSDYAAPFIAFQQLQIQAYGIRNDQFGHYNDCQGFFSIGIWMALISMVIMIAIVVFGIIMLSNITTMDRYDDPKGKTIIVAAGTD
jgi:V-type H+-transporting ATPase S1 subunit